MRLVGLDLGGTSIKGGVASEQGAILDHRSVEIDHALGADGLIDAMAGLARDLGADRCVGLGAPGLFDRERGVVLESPNLSFLEGVSLRDELARRLSLDESAVLLENDANAAAIGEHWVGAGRGETDFLMITLGTGVGGGFILASQLYAGPGGMAGEIGHVVVDPGGLPCGCGSRGCLETLASATAAQRRAKALALPRDRPGDLILLAEMARRGPGPERALLFEVGRDLGRGLAGVVTLLDVRLFVIGGGFGGALDVLEPGVRVGLGERTYGGRLEHVRIVPAELGTDAGWMGAARLTLSFPPR